MMTEFRARLRVPKPELWLGCSFEEWSASAGRGWPVMRFNNFPYLIFPTRWQLVSLKKTYGLGCDGYPMIPKWKTFLVETKWGDWLDDGRIMVRADLILPVRGVD